MPRGYNNVHMALLRAANSNLLGWYVTLYSSILYVALLEMAYLRDRRSYKHISSTLVSDCLIH